MKKYLVIIAMTVGSLSVTFATNQTKINRLQMQLNRIQGRVNQLKTKKYYKGKKPAPIMTHKRFFDNYVVIAPYTGKKTYNTGAALIINDPAINEDARLLVRRMLEYRAIRRAGLPAPTHPRLVLSGKVEGQAIYTRPYIGSRSSDVDLSGVELDTFIEATKWVNGFMGITYDNAAGDTPRRTSNSNLRLDKGYLLIGNFEKSPFYGSLGQLYVPFGRYNSNMMSSPLNKYVGRTKTRAIVVGYAPQKDITPMARVFLAKGDTHYGGNDFARLMGVDVSFKILEPKYNFQVGTSYINNMADAEGMQDNGYSSGFRGFDTSNVEKLNHRVDGLALYTTAGYGPFSALAEYEGAMRAFSNTDLSYNGHGAKPRAYNLEAGYSFKFWNRPTTFAVGFGRSDQALGLNIAQKRYDAILTMTIIKDLEAKLEYCHNINYGRLERATGEYMTAYTENELGRTNDTITAELGVYF